MTRSESRPQNEGKQNTDKSDANAGRDAVAADELGKASAYDDATVIAQQMRRGDETKGDPDERDVVGATDFKDVEEGRTDRDTTARETTGGGATTAE